MTTPAETVRQHLDRYAAAVLARDADGLLALYDPDVRVFDTWAVWSYDGAVAWRAAVDGWFGSLVDERCRVTFDDVRIVGDAGLAAMSAVVTYTAITPDGAALRSMQNRIDWVLRAGGDRWRVVHEHTSVPVGFDDGKAILTRHPGT